MIDDAKRGLLLIPAPDAARRAVNLAKSTAVALMSMSYNPVRKDSSGKRLGRAGLMIDNQAFDGFATGR